MNKRSITALGIAVGLVLFFAVNLLAGTSLRTWRLDLTEDKLYTLSEGARNIARNLDEEIRLSLFFSEKAAADLPFLKSYAARVREVLEEYALVSDGMITLEVLDPEPFSTIEDRASQAGLAALSAGPGADAFFFGLVGTNSVDGQEVIPMLDASKERFLEYDVSRLIWALGHPERTVVGVVSSLPLSGGPPNPMNPAGAAPPWAILGQINTVMETRDLGASFETIDDDVDVLLLIHPKDLSDAALYAIDQFVLGGGKVVAAVDPHCDAAASSDPMARFQQRGASQASDLGPLLDAWGVELVSNKVVGDRQNAMRVNAGQPNRPKVVDFVVWMGFDKDEFDGDDAVTSLLENMIVPTAGILRPSAEATTEFTPLIQTSEDAMQIDVGMIQFMPDPENLLTSFVSEKQRYAIAARVHGPTKSAYPDGKPAAPEEESSDASAPEEDAADSGDSDQHLTESAGPIDVVLIADADFLMDRFWIQEQTLGPISLGFMKTSNNGDFVINALENLSGGEDLIAIRARGRYSRPFERVDEIRREAERRYLAEEQGLQRKLDAANQRINDLQREKTGETAMILSPAQQLELENARAEMVETKSALRGVQHSLRKDIERLGTQLKWLNIALLPALISAAAIGLGTLRIRRRQRQ